MNDPNATAHLAGNPGVGSSELLDALAQATDAHLEEAMKGCDGASPQLILALKALARESFQAGFRSGVRHMEKQKASSAKLTDAGSKTP